jgi:hypothetical protein
MVMLRSRPPVTEHGLGKYADRFHDERTCRQFLGGAAPGAELAMAAW